jgi:hypothetical protein
MHKIKVFKLISFTKVKVTMSKIFVFMEKSKALELYHSKGMTKLKFSKSRSNIKVKTFDTHGEVLSKGVSKP